MSAEGSTARRDSPWRHALASEGARIWYALLALVIASLIIAPHSLSERAILTMLPVAAILAVASLGQSLTIQQGGIDFTVPGVMTMAAVLVTGESTSQDAHLLKAVVIALVVSGVIGLASGLAVALFRVTPIIATLAVNALALGAVSSYASSAPKQSPPALASFAIDRTLGVPNTIYIALAVVVIAVVVQTRMTVGRRFVAIGDNPRTARAMGLPVTRYVIGTYIAASLLYGMAGIMLAGYVVAPSLSLGTPYLLSTITAVVIGGTAFGGGRARLVGAAVAALFLTQLNSLLNAISAPPSTSLLLQAVAIAIAVGVGPVVDRLRHQRRLRELAVGPTMAEAA
ncbi:MAG: ribose transport system permease protein [Nocardioidaceae bacterium]|jgi:ribose transport system permease protein|nr:ribose transport system permease protein [Nocardioidaceae bacterium]